MNPYQKYQQHQVGTMSRIDLILALLRKAIELVDQATASLDGANISDHRTRLAKAQAIVACLASGMAGNTDETAVNFLRLYEFVTSRLASGERDDMAAARQVLTILLEAFASVHAQATELESSGALPPLGTESGLCVTA